jgi:predicted lipid-binding transport protein (Tim44 family)
MGRVDWKTLTRAAVVGLAVVGTAMPVDARPGGGGSSGSRGSRTNDAPAATQTAPTAQPMQRTQTPAVAQRPGVAGGAAAAAQPSRGLGFGGGLMAGLLGAGLIGMMMGGGLFSGLAGFASILGLMIQVALIGGLIWLAVRFFRRRNEPVAAGGMSRSALGSGGLGSGGVGSGGVGGNAAPAATVPMGAGMAAPQAVKTEEIRLDSADFDTFEKLLGEVQMAFGREDIGRIRDLTTAEMAGYLEADLADNARRGVRNEVSQPKLLQGDLSEAWREGSSFYATVAMRFSVIDATVDRQTGRIVEGNATQPTEATELWTFRREGVGNWHLSAIQQTH